MADKIEILPLSNSAANQIKYEITRPEKLEKYFEGDEFIAEYGFGLENIPEEILSIPALTAVTPLAWATDTEIHIDTVEEGFLESLKETRFKYNEHYPDVFGNGCCIKPNSTKKIPHDKESVIVNFSGGVDSTATYLRHRSNPTILTSVDHASYSESESNLRIKYLEKLNNLPHTHTEVVSMNGRQMRNKRAIEDDFKEKIGRSWWGAVQYSITYFGLCAPIAYTYNSTEILQAASFTPNSTYPDSQMPVRGLKWADTECKVDGIELSRQEKVDLIAEEVEGEDWTQLNVCEKTTESESDHLNCSQCAKCVRTIMGLYIAGVDPAKYGFKEDLSSLELIQTGFESKTIQLKPYGLEMFQDMQKKIDNDRIMKENSEEFVGWFKQYEFEKNLRTPSIKRRVYQTAPNPFDRWLKRVYETIQSRRS